MGIPSYFSYIVKNHANIIRRLKQNTIQVNNLYLDCNSIIYDAVHSMDSASITTNGIISHVIAKIEEYISLIQPNQNVFIAFDGVAPVAKLEQQRDRRYKSWFQNEIFKGIKKTSVDPWNTAAITPGTVFMSELGAKINSHFLKKHLRYNCSKIMVSTSDDCGEGEHKLFQYIRSNPEEHADGIVTVVYGLDADLIMLSINHLPISKQIYLFRETPHFIKTINSSLEPDQTYLLDIPELSRIITSDLSDNVTLGEATRNVTNRVYDYIFICFFLGNDFMPHFPAVNIRTNGIAKMLNAYKATIGIKEGCILTDGKTIYWKNVQKMVAFLSCKEEEYLKEETKLRDKRGKYHFPVDTPEQECAKFEAIPTYEREIEKYINPFKDGWQERYYKALFGGIVIDDVKREEICKNYMAGLEWTMKYYTTGCADWRWHYKYNYPPLLQDLVKFIPYFEREFVPCVSPRPVNPLVQLCYVLPRPSLQLLPKKLYDILMKTHGDWYRTDFEFCWAYSKYFWEAHVQFPEIDIDELECLINKKDA